jgi:uncharacterized caspase-like protein
LVFYSIGLLVSITASGRAYAAERLALLIGNQNYSDKVGKLRNPYNDVRLVSNALKRLGFDVTEVRDANYRDMDTAVKKYIAKVKQAGEGAISFVYYSGHGAANTETRINYLIPVDVESADDNSLVKQMPEGP